VSVVVVVDEVLRNLGFDGIFPGVLVVVGPFDAIFEAVLIGDFAAAHDGLDFVVTEWDGWRRGGR